MATRANIVVQTGPKTFKVIYTHSDGYVSYMGVYLNRFHNTEEAAKEIVRQGDMPYLEPLMAPPPGVDHHFDHDRRHPFTSVFYARDREPENRSHMAATARTLEGALALTGHHAVYAWLKDKGWTYAEWGDLSQSAPDWGLVSLADFIKSDDDCQERIAKLDADGMTLEWRDAGAPGERVEDGIYFHIEARPIGWVDPKSIMAQRYIDEALF